MFHSQEGSKLILSIFVLYTFIFNQSANSIFLTILLQIALSLSLYHSHPHNISTVSEYRSNLRRLHTFAGGTNFGVQHLTQRLNAHNQPNTLYTNHNRYKIWIISPRRMLSAQILMENSRFFLD